LIPFCLWCLHSTNLTDSALFLLSFFFLSFPPAPVSTAASTMVYHAAAASWEVGSDVSLVLIAGTNGSRARARTRKKKERERERERERESVPDR
jgi:hypothetical protein